MAEHGIGVDELGSAERAVKLTDYFISLPRALYIFVFVLALGFLFGVSAYLVAYWGRASGYDSIAGAFGSGLDGVLLVSVPAVLSALTATFVKREMTIRRSMFVAFVSALIYVASYLAEAQGQARGISSLVFVGYGLAFILWFVSARVVFGLKYGAFLIAALQLVYNAVFLYMSRIIYVSSDPVSMIIRVYFASFVFLLAVYALFWLFNAPMKRNFGVSSVDAASLFLAQWFRQSRDIEELFETVGEEVETTVGVLALRFDGRSLLMIVPNIHYGPFGNLGGSEFPQLIAERVKKATGSEVMVFHGTATHDFNPVSAGEIEHVADAVSRAVDRMKFRNARASFVVGKSKTARANMLFINDFCMAGLTRAPRTTEDVDFSLGLAIRAQALCAGMRDVLLVDAHNSETGEITQFHSGDPVGFEYMDAVADGAAGAGAGAMAPLRAGFASDSLRNFGVPVGGAGLKLAVFKMGRSEFVPVLFDANGVTPGFRRKLIDAMKEAGFGNCEVFTTDTHSVNAVTGVLNPLGEEKSDELIARVIACAKEAEKNSAPARADMRTERMAIKVFGVQQSSELLGTINSIVAIARIAVPAVLVATALLVLWGVANL
ncbi:MAG: DUF2070 family protein [Candidatus Micrarchaeota archaeon]|nr:DUF2070 family protein [Candidatus Micrarchaeota archaeon]